MISMFGLVNLFGAGMTSSSRKSIKIVGNKRKDKEPVYFKKFLSISHERLFLILEGRRLLVER